MHLTVRKSHL